MIDIDIRDVQLSDQEGINEIIRLVTKEGDHDLRPYKRDVDLEVYASEEDYEFFVAVNLEKAVGYIEMHYYGAKSMIMQLFVHPNFRNQGIGRDLIKRLISAVQNKGRYSEIYLQVKGGNRAIDLYKQEGFLETKKVDGGIEMVCKI